MLGVLFLTIYCIGYRSEWQKAFEKLAEREGSARSRRSSIWSFHNENRLTGRRASLARFAAGIFARKPSVVSVDYLGGEKEIDVMLS
jgi:hypothetical protein